MGKNKICKCIQLLLPKYVEITSRYDNLTNKCFDSTRQSIWLQILTHKHNKTSILLKLYCYIKGKMYKMMET